MMISETEAVDAFRSFLVASHRASMTVQVVSVTLSELEGQECWAIETIEPLAPDEPDWFRLYDPPEIYFIDAISGRCIASRGRTFTRFPSDGTHATPSANDDGS